MGDCYELVQPLSPAERAGAFETLSELQKRT
jgi:hypothetical protein